MTILYCPETPDLKLGPGVKPGDPDIVLFIDGYAEVSRDDPLYDEKMSWVKHPGSPLIRVLGEDETPANAPGAVACERCGKAFPNEQALNGHLISHRRKG